MFITLHLTVLAVHTATNMKPCFITIQNKIHYVQYILHNEHRK